MASLITKQSSLPKDESTPLSYPGPLLPKARAKPQEDAPWNQNRWAMEAFLFPFQETQQIPQMYPTIYAVLDNQITKQNQNLLSRMLKIETEPMRNTLNIIPKTIPSNKGNFLELKARERKAEANAIRK